jgi:MFS family permease
VLFASNLGWLFDGFEIFSIFLTVGFALRQLLDPSQYAAIPQYAGYILAGTVAGWATGGVVGGIIADYIGRKRTMMLAILAYSLTTGLSAIAWDWPSFLVLRFLVGVGIGLEWATGASIVSEMWPDHARGKGGGLLQMGAGIGSVIASLVWLGIGDIMWGRRQRLMQSDHRYLKEITGLNFWVRRALHYPVLALGRARGLPFVPESVRRSIALSMSAQLLIYAAGFVSIVLGSHALLYYWFLPAVLAQPFLRSLLIVEHTECSLDRNGLTNTRTTLTGLPIRLLMWNMPYHVEHHLYPAVPFHELPRLHREIRDRLTCIAPSYRAANRAVLQSL